MATISKIVIKKIVKKLILPGENYRMEVVEIINAQFLEFAINFFKEVSAAKIEDKEITPDWYKAAFIDNQKITKSIALNAGINMKTISNIHGSERRDIVIDVANAHYESLQALIEKLTEDEDGIDFSITIKIGKVGVELNISESLIVINALAVRRAAMRGGVWSSAGKRTEKILMQTLCHLYSVEEEYRDAIQKDADGEETYEREIDFFLVKDDTRHKCEVKLMGKGNPESADAVIARKSKVFVADTLSDTNKAQLDSLGVLWVALKDNDGYQRFGQVLVNLNIPHENPNTENLSARIDEILSTIDM